MKALILLFALIAVSCNDSKPPFDRVKMLTNVADKVIVQAFTGFNNEASSLQKSLHSFQENPSPSSLDAARLQWVKTANSWSQCELYIIGPFKDSYTSNRIYTVPTREKYIERFVREGESIDVDYIA
jgi:predicted lipoprotein